MENPSRCENTCLEHDVEVQKLCEGVTELFTDYDHVALSMEKYEQLVEDRAMLKVIGRLYRKLESYDCQRLLRAVFEPREDDNDA